jgi:hypothetical protein
MHDPAKKRSIDVKTTDLFSEGGVWRYFLSFSGRGRACARAVAGPPSLRTFSMSPFFHPPHLLK